MKIVKVMALMAFIGYKAPMLAWAIRNPFLPKLSRAEVDKIKERANTEINPNVIETDINKLLRHGNDKAAGHLKVIYNQRKEAEKKRDADYKKTIERRQALYENNKEALEKWDKENPRRDGS